MYVGIIWTTEYFRFFGGKTSVHTNIVPILGIWQLKGKCFHILNFFSQVKVSSIHRTKSQQWPPGILLRQPQGKTWSHTGPYITAWSGNEYLFMIFPWPSSIPKSAGNVKYHIILTSLSQYCSKNKNTAVGNYVSMLLSHIHEREGES